MKRITLEIQYADKRTELRQLEDGAYIIGRDTGDIVLKSTLVSGRHGELKVSGSQVIYTDQGSTNGTFTFDGSRLTGPLQMSAGSGLRIGECKIILKAIHMLTSKTVLQTSVKPAFSSTKTVLGQPAAIFPPPSSRPPAPASRPPAPASRPPVPASRPPAPASRPPVAKIPSPMPVAASAAPSRPPASRPPVSKTPSPAPFTPATDATAPTVAQSSVAPPATKPASSAAPAAASVPPVANAATEPAPPPYAVGPDSDTEAESFDDVAYEVASDVTPEPAGGNALVREESVSESGSEAFSGFSYDMDIGALVNAPMQDKGWITKCIIMGLIGLIPVAGQLNLWGWLIAIYNSRKQGGEELPPANLSYIGDGVKILLAWLPAIGAYIAVSIVLGVITFILPFLFFLSPLMYLAMGLAFLAASPAVMYLCVEKDVKWASLKINDILAFAKANNNAYMQLIIAVVVAGLIAGAGSIVFIGSIITIPFGIVMQAAMLAGIKE